MRFTVTASGKNQVVLSGATVKVSSNYTTTSAHIRIYKNSISDDNEL
ncbi:MAG: hypothetical protein LBQ24_07135 [Candidatus Peribacteria bacterium]|nr:hypothetical protein [Candidatus Peribacteria bacterium]